MSATIRAYTVTSKYGEAGVLAFAHNPTEAKQLARRSEWLEDAEWIELRAKREPKSDIDARERGVGIIDGQGKDDGKIMRLLGWWCIETGGDPCEDCGLFEWEGVEESTLDENGVCGECRAGKEKA